MSKIEVNQISSQCGSTLTIGQSGDTVTLACGATAAGFGSTGEVSWDTTKKTSGFTAVSGVGYFCDTTSAAFTVTLPATPSAGNVVAVSDYAGTFGTNGLTIGRNGSNINGSANDFVINKNNVTAQFIYVDATQGWKVVFTGSQTGEGLQESFVCATGGTITTCGSCKIHTFTGPGTFTVNSLACTSGNNVVGYMVVAGGGGGGAHRGGGGGAGGFREGRTCSVTPYTVSPLAVSTGLTVTTTSYPITVGSGGAGEPCAAPARGVKGNNSVFSTITSAGGGSGRNDDVPLSTPSDSGGSGGGAGGGSNPVNIKGEGNTPPVSPSQGSPGADSVIADLPPANPGGGGGGATAPGQGPGPGGTPSPVAHGGAGATTSISGSPTAYAGGGGAGVGSGGTGGGGDPSPSSPAGNGTANTGGGGGGGQNFPYGGGSGGSGIVIIRYKYQ
jgi:hypothetical protein